VEVNLDNAERISIATGIGFFDHMLEQLAKHGNFSLIIKVSGDLHIDDHHTVEDVALAIGEALRQALGDKLGIGRYGFLLPMDESLAQVALDLSGRPFFEFKGLFSREQVGNLSTELVPHFFQSLADSLKANLHIEVKGSNTHHMIEATFKAVGRALRQALAKTDKNLPSTKGVL
jgi:imidazoleglycerol-phosphate dehydratase/histidinol-phosphatase